MKYKLKPFLLILPFLALTLSACNMFDIFINRSGSSTITRYSDKQIDFNTVTYSTLTEPTRLKYTNKDLYTNNHYNIDCLTTYTEGAVTEEKILVIPVWFTDSTLYIPKIKRESVRKDIFTTFFGTPEQTGWNSVQSYYEAESHGQFILHGEVTTWYECGLKARNLKADEAQSILIAAVEEWKEKNPDEVKKYDVDGNGFLDAVALIYGYADVNSTHSKSNDELWAYTYWLQDVKGDVDSPNPNAFMFASYDFMYNDIKNCKLDAHTFIHETGHLLGLEDYYDYSENNYEAAAGFSMQDYNIGGHDPYSVLSFGWATPFIPTESCKVTLHPFQSSGELVLISNHNVTSVFDEYILLEFYTPTGLNEFDVKHQYNDKYPIGPNDIGIRVWHVDSRLVRIEKNVANESNVCSDITAGNKYLLVCSNTCSTPETENYSSVISSFAPYKQLELIRKGDMNGLLKKTNLTADNLFKQGDIFSFGRYTPYFANAVTMNNKAGALGWQFKIDSLNEESATISIVKE